MTNQNNQPKAISVNEFKKLVNNIVKETIESEAITWPAEFWTEDDVDTYRQMNHQERQSVDNQLKHFADKGNNPFSSNQSKENECMAEKKQQFANEATNRIMKKLTESLNSGATPTPAPRAKTNAMSRLI